MGRNQGDEPRVFVQWDETKNEKSKDKTTLNVVEDEDPEIINDFDFVENDKNEEENDAQHVEDE